MTLIIADRYLRTGPSAAICEICGKQNNNLPLIPLIHADESSTSTEVISDHLRDLRETKQNRPADDADHR
jgi:hypothetical protein